MAVLITNTNPNVRSTIAALTLTFAFDCTGGNYLLVPCRDEAGSTITGVTYNGVALSQLAFADRSTGGMRLYMYGLLNPATGSNNVIITRTGASNRIDGFAAAVSGAKTTQPANTFSGNNGTSTTTSGTIMTTTLNEGVFGLQLADNGGDTAGANTTIISQTPFGDLNFTRSTVFPTATAQNVTLIVQSGVA